MHIQYGQVHLNLISINELSRQAVYMGSSYVYTRFKLNIRCWLNPRTQGDTPNAKAPAQHPPPNGPLIGKAVNTGVKPVVSDVALRHDLLQPRQKLVFNFLGTNNIVSPLPGFPCDATGGPKPSCCNIQQITPQTWVVDWAVSMDINEAYLYSYSGMPLILAQAFSIKHHLDEDFFTTRVLEGQALFRLDALQASALTPDDFRSLLIVPPPLGFKREKVEVESDPENQGLLKYKVVDRQLPFGWYNKTITRLEAHHRIKTTKRRLGDILMEHAPELAKAGSSFLGSSLLFGADALAASIPSVLEPLFAAGTLPTGWAFLRDLGKLGWAGAKTVYDALPLSYHNIEVIASGSPTSTRADIENFCRQIVSARLSSFFVAALPTVLAGAGVNVAAGVVGAAIQYSTPFATSLINFMNSANRATTGAAGQVISSVTSPLSGGASGVASIIVPYGVETEIDHLISSKSVRLTYTAITGPLGSIFNGASAVFNISPMPNMEETFTSTGQPLISTLNTPPLPSKSLGTRGTWLADVVSQALQAANSLPPDLPAGNAPMPREGFPLTV